jgi:hypothetical protein
VNRRQWRRRRRDTSTTHRRWCGLAALLAGTAVALAAYSGSGAPSATRSPTVASLATTTTTASGITTTTRSSGSRSTSTTVPRGGNATKLVDEWATCMRSNGDPNQADPIIDTHGVINITIGAGASQALASEVRGGTDQQTGTCSQYLSAAQRVLRRAFPLSSPPNNSALLNYVACMRANGVPNYPDPTGDKSNLNGINTNSPTFLKANNICGKKIDAPAWWTNGWGPPGDISVRSCVNGSQTVACPSGSPPAGGETPGSEVGSNG